jgi:hypothetical protein
MGIPACFVPLRRGTFRPSVAQQLREEMHGAMRLSDSFRADGFWRAGWLAILTTGWLLGAAGCGSGDQTAHGAASSSNAKSHKQHKNEAATKPGEQPLADMVAAVSGSKGPPVELKFSLPTRPEVGQVTEIDVAVVPRMPVPDSVSVSFQTGDGLDLVEGSQLERIEQLTDGSPVRHIVKVLPKRDGIFAVTAVVSFTAKNQDFNRTFSIPVIAGEGMPEQVAKGP